MDLSLCRIPSFFRAAEIRAGGCRHGKGKVGVLWVNWLDTFFWWGRSVSEGRNLTESWQGFNAVLILKSNCWMRVGNTPRSPFRVSTR